MPDRPRLLGSDTRSIDLIGRPRPGIRDVYYLLLAASWPAVLVIIIGNLLLLNLVFAIGYLVVGGVANMAPGSYQDAFFFSVQTFATIGYGDMHPTTAPANFLVSFEALIGVVVNAVTTGLLFAKFATVRARVVFAPSAVVTPEHEVPTLMIRLGNALGNDFADAAAKLTLVQVERTADGTRIPRLRDLAVLGDDTGFAGFWIVKHAIDESSPLHGATPESLRAAESQVLIACTGVDTTTGQVMNARHWYLASEILYGRRYVHIVSELPDGRFQVDLRRFDAVEPDGTQRSVGDERRGHLDRIATGAGGGEILLQGPPATGEGPGEDQGPVLSRGRHR